MNCSGCDVATMSTVWIQDEHERVVADPQTASARAIVIAANRLLRDALESALTATGLRVVATVETADSLSPALVRDGMAQVVLMEIGLTPAATIASVRELTSHNRHLDVIVIDVGLGHTVSDLIDLLDAGASGLLSTRATVDDIIRTTQAVLGGATVIPRFLTRALLPGAAAQLPSATAAGLADAERLTMREQQIVALIADGLGNKDIAAALNISIFTVKSHVHNILQKLTLETRAQIARHVLSPFRRPRPGSESPAVSTEPAPKAFAAGAGRR